MAIQFIRNRVYRLTSTGAVVAAVVGGGLIGCGQQVDSPADNVPDANEIARQAASEMQNDQRMANELLKELQKTDPSIFDVYMDVDAQGKKVAVISRKAPDGSVESWTTPPVEQLAQEKQQQEASSGGPSMGSTLMSMAMGALAGYALANMFSNRVNRHASPAQYQQNKAAAQSNYQRSVAQGQQQRAATRANSLRQQGAFGNSNNSSQRRQTYSSGSGG